MLINTAPFLFALIGVVFFLFLTWFFGLSVEARIDGKLEGLKVIRHAFWSSSKPEKLAEYAIGVS